VPSAERQLDVALAGRGAPLLDTAPRDEEVVSLRHTDAEERRVDLRDRRQQRAFAAAYEIARLHQRRPHQPADRRRDPGVPKVESGLFDGGLARVHPRARRVLLRERVIQLALADGLLGDQRLVTRNVVVRLGQAGLGRGLIGPRLRQSRFERLTIDLVEQVALPHE
jgi:hypothetical protein